jgi:hypothetical protein
MALLDPAADLNSSIPEKVQERRPAPGWSPARRTLFRLVCSYLVLLILPFPLSYIPFVNLVAQQYEKLWHALVPWVGKVLFQVEVPIEVTGSGDTMYSYLQVLCYLILAVIATAVWTLLDRNRLNYARLHEWLRVLVRFSLAATMLGYGLAKVIPTQFPSPSLDRLLQPFGDASPMGLLWTFMGASAAYTIFTGLAEVLGGLLLVARRTTLLGSLVCIAVLNQVVMLNFCYDVPVKLYSSHLLAMAVFLAAPDLRRLADLLLFHRRVEPAEIRPLFQRRWLNVGGVVLRTVLIAALVGFQVYGNYQFYQGFREKSPLYGVWTVEGFETDGKIRPPLITDETRWRRVVFDSPRMIAVQWMSDSRKRYVVQHDPAKRTLALTRRDDPQWKAGFSYDRPEPGLLTLEGTFEGQKIRARLRKAKETELLLVSRGFHWIQEYPFNR